MTILKEKHINPFTDFGFKRIFGDEVNKDLLIDFLNSLFNGEPVIKEVSYKSLMTSSKSRPERTSVFDLYCTTNKGERIIIEMQKAKQNYFKDRSFYYSTYPLQEQALSGEWNFRLDPVITIGILDFIVDEKDKDKPIVSEVMLTETRTGKVFFEKLVYIFLQIPNFTKKEDELKSRLEKWLYVLKNLNQQLEFPHLQQDNIFKKLFAISDIASLTREEIQQYEHSLKVFRDLKNTMDTAYSVGKTDGKKQGLMEAALLLVKSGTPLSQVVSLLKLPEQYSRELKYLLNKFGDEAERHIGDFG
jgi:predicted transposase/invertase (TIGR01784 family)